MFSHVSNKSLRSTCQSLTIGGYYSASFHGRNPQIQGLMPVQFPGFANKAQSYGRLYLTLLLVLNFLVIPCWARYYKTQVSTTQSYWDLVTDEDGYFYGGTTIIQKISPDLSTSTNYAYGFVDNRHFAWYNGTLYVVDQGAKAIKLVSTGGVVSVYPTSQPADWKTGSGPFGIGITNTGVIYVTSSDYLYRLNYGGTPTLIATLVGAGGITVGIDGYLYVTSSSCISRVAPSTGIVTSLVCGYSASGGITMDYLGNVIFLDSMYVYRINLPSGMVSLLSPDIYTFSLPSGVCINTLGTIYIVSLYTNAIFRITHEYIFTKLARRWLIHRTLLLVRTRFTNLFPSMSLI